MQTVSATPVQPSTAPSPPEMKHPEPATQPPMKNVETTTIQQHVVDEKKESPSAEGYIPHEDPMNSTSVTNGGMPPQQVYVNTAMSHHHHMGDLDTQFQALGMNDVSHQDGVDEEDGTGVEGNDEDEPVKLFVGQVRKQKS